MKILLHTCCSNCAIYPLEVLKYKKFEVTLYWYNPNIHPYTEYRLRLDSLKKLQQLWKLEIIYNEDYREFYKFIRMISGKEKERCLICYKLRLEETARKAKELGFSHFTTTLLVSPYQNFDKIIEIGREISVRLGINFLEEDFRKGFKKGMNTGKALELYKQRYCGCIYSEAERYLKEISYE
ncbi:MAG: epoxyqueuosine reductase QueH [Thermodesulfovibrio sp.]|nr:epoxyqueuosine reductase QueH [Thermodesulfovibrio sp.]